MDQAEKKQDSPLEIQTTTKKAGGGGGQKNQSV